MACHIMEPSFHVKAAQPNTQTPQLLQALLQLNVQVTGTSEGAKMDIVSDKGKQSDNKDKSGVGQTRTLCGRFRGVVSDPDHADSGLVESLFIFL